MNLLAGRINKALGELSDHPVPWGDLLTLWRIDADAFRELLEVESQSDLPPPFYPLVRLGAVVAAAKDNPSSVYRNCHNGTARLEIWPGEKVPIPCEHAESVVLLLEALGSPLRRVPLPSTESKLGLREPTEDTSLKSTVLTADWLESLPEQDRSDYLRNLQHARPELYFRVQQELQRRMVEP